ncbi:MAG: mechanosensitive ion channel family protein [Gammaproteobacteria bacterium]|nr:mechanosensitive ion channel family protein [Gammaproteobacteria bacterium]
MEFLGFNFGSIDIGTLWRAVLAYASLRWIPTAATIVLAAVVYFIVRWILGRAKKRWVKRTETRLDDHFVEFLLSAGLFSIIAWAAWRLIHVWSIPNETGDAPLAADWVLAIWVGLLFLPLSRFIGDILDVVEGRVIAKGETTLDETAFPLINRTVRFIILALGAVLALDLLGLNIAPLLAGAGVMGLALSLAAKDTLSNLIAGVLLIMDRPFKVGDRIELWSAPNETGTWGDVIEIGLRATKIRNPDNLVIVVPNSQIMVRDIINYTMSGQDIRLRIPFSVAYESDIDRAKVLLIEAAKKVEGVKLSPEPIVIVRGFGPSDVQIQLRVWILEARNRRRIADEITGKAVAAFADAGVEIPYPKRELIIHGESEQAPRRLPRPG